MKKLCLSPLALSEFQIFVRRFEICIEWVGLAREMYRDSAFRARKYERYP
jgi:hypothetical protein